MNDLKKYYRENKIFCIILIIFSAAIAATLLSINFKGHDYPYHIQRIASIAEEIRFKGLGAFPIRVFSTNEYGYGYASPMFYGDIFLYPFAFLILLGMNAVYAYRIMLLSLYVICFLGMYFAAKQVSKSTQTAIIAACLYAFSSYFAIDVFTRSAIGEAYAFAFCPYAAYGFYCTVIKPEMPKKHRLFLVFGMSGMILSHLISTVVITVFMAVFMIIYRKNWIKQKSILGDFILLALLTCALSAFFIFPMLEQMASSKFYATAGTNWNSAYYGLPWLSWIAPHGFWKLMPDRYPEIANGVWFPGSFGFMVVTLLAIWLVNFKKLKKTAPIALLILSIAIVLIISGKIIPLTYTHKLFDFMRLPWRTLLFCTFFMSIFGAYAAHTLKSKLTNWILLIMLIIPLAIVSASSYKIILKEIPNMKSNYELTSDQIGTGYEYLPYNLTQTAENDFNGYLRSIDKKAIPHNSEITISDFTDDEHGRIEFSFTGNTHRDASIEVPLLYYKGYSAIDTVTRAKYKITESQRGFVRVNIENANSGTVKVRYTGTAVQHISDIISFLTLMCILLYLFKPSVIRKLREKMKPAGRFIASKTKPATEFAASKFRVIRKKIPSIKHKKTAAIYALSFVLPFLCLSIIYIALNVYPFGNRTVLIMDLNNQYNEFYVFLHRVLTGQDSLFYSFTKEMGGNTFGLFAYYLSSPFSILTLFFSQETMPACVVLMTLLKVGASGLTFAIFLRHVFKKCDWSVVLFSCCYALSTYSLFYSLCVMWLDTVIWLPIVLLGIERVLKNKSPLLFIIAFAITLFSNYYTAYMTALFSVIYFIYRYVSEDGEKSFKDFSRKTLIMAVAAIVCTLLAAVILVPTFMSMIDGKLTYEFNIPKGFWNQKIFEIPRRLFIGQYDSIHNDGSPGIFCGVICGILTGMYFLNPEIKARKRIASFCVFAVLIVSFFIKRVDMAWHVFKWPIAFPYRYAYVFCFFSVFIAYSGFVKLKKSRLSWMIAGVVLYTSMLAAVLIFDKDVIKNTKWAYLSFVFAAAYIASIFIIRFKVKKIMPYIYRIMILLVCSELIINGYLMMSGFGYGAYSQSGYVETVSKTQNAMDYINNYDNGFYRAEKTYLRSDNDNISTGIRGTTSFSSTFNQNIFDFVDRVGMRRVLISAKYHGSTMLTDSLLGIRYIISDSNKEINDDYELLHKGENYSVYRNPYALNIGYAAPDSVSGDLPDEATTFDNQNKLSELLLGRKVYKNITDSQTEKDGKVTGFTVPETGSYYIDFGKLYTNKPIVEINGENKDYRFDFSSEKRIYYLGKLNRGDNVKINLDDYDLSLDIKVAMIDTNALKKGVEGIPAEKQLNITNYGYTWFEGDVKLDKNELLFTTIPYESGWTAYVDGKKAEIICAQNTFLAVDTGEGYHHVKLKYHAPGFRISIAISLLTLLALLAVVYREKLIALLRSEKILK